MVIEKIVRKLSDISFNEMQGREIDIVQLDHFDIAKPHQKLKSKGGRTFGLSLEQGETLMPGDVVFEDNGIIVVIEMIEEDVLEITPVNNLEWGRAAFNIGNMHQSAYVYNDCIRIPYDYIMESLLTNLGVRIERKMAKLDGIKANVTVKEHGGAVNAHAHTHTHTHTHSHDHTHEHEHANANTHTEIELHTHSCGDQEPHGHSHQHHYHHDGQDLHSHSHAGHFNENTIKNQTLNNSSIDKGDTNDK